MSKWKKVKLGDVVSFNPKETISKENLVKKIAMEQLLPFCRKIQGFEMAYFKGGSKFRNNDTLLARITPCLENGKTSFVDILKEDEIAFGSTEFIVMREKQGISDAKFIYYLSTSPYFRELAIKSMVGSSGRQRVQQDVLENIKIPLPPLEEQKRIAAILSSLDDKIEVNNQINKNLEEQAQAIFKSWFVDFEPFGGVMPSDWRKGTLGDVCILSNSKMSTNTLTKKNYFSTENMLPNKAGVTTASSLPTVKNVTKCSIGNILISNIRPYFKKIHYCTTDSGCSNDVLCFAAKSNELSHYLYFLLYDNNFFEYMMLGSKGTKMPRGDKEQIMQYKCNIPSDCALSNFSNIVSFFLDLIDNNRVENIKLSQLRNVLLSKLMNGEINV